MQDDAGDVVYPRQTLGGGDVFIFERLFPVILPGAFITLWRARCSALVQLENHTKNPYANILLAAQW